ncbi:MAG: TonB-dependent receptor [Bacteroidales bacterium]
MKYYISLLFILICIPSFSQGVSFSPYSKTDTTQNHRELEEVVVIGNKEQGATKSLPISGTSLKSYELKQQNVFSLKDVSLIVPNLFFPDYGTKLTSPVYIRGIGSRINSPSVGLYVDGIPYFEKSAFDFDLMEIAQIEVLRGPQGTLYGRNTMGGIINITTFAPLSYEGTHLYLNTGNYSKFTGTVSHYGKINEHWGYSISGSFNSNDGYFYNVTTDSKADAIKSGSGRARLRYKKEKWDVSLVTSLELSDQSGYPYMKVDTLTKLPTHVDYNDPSFFKRTLNSNGLFANYHNEKILLTSRTAHQFYDGHQGIDQDFSPQSLYYINQFEKQHMLSQEFEIKNARKGRFAWTAGVFGFYQSLVKQVEMKYYKQQFTTDKHYDSPSYGYSFFGQGSINDLFVEGLTFTAGLRYDKEYSTMHFRSFRETSAGKVELTDANFSHDLRFSQVSPKVSLQYAITPSKTVYATVTKGYKAGGFNTSFVTDEEKSFDPEHSWNYEIGAKLSFADGKLTTEAALFYIDWLNQQVYQPLSTGTGSLLRNAGKSISKGAELTVNWRVIEDLQLQASYGYTHATFKEYINGKENLSGKFLPYVPRNTVGANLNYTIRPNDRSMFNRILLSLNYNGVRELYWNDKNSMKQGYYSTVGARATFQMQQFTTALWAKNIFNTDYTAFYFEALGSSFVQKGRPMTFGIDLSYTF